MLPMSRIEVQHPVPSTFGILTEVQCPRMEYPNGAERDILKVVQVREGELGLPADFLKAQSRPEKVPYEKTIVDD